MFRVDNIWGNGLLLVHYFSPQLGISNGFLSDPNKDGIQKLHMCEASIPTYYVGVQKLACVSYVRVMFRKNPSKINFLGPFSYCVPWQGLSKGFLIDPNRDRMESLCPQEVDVPTYHFKVHKTIIVLFYM